MCVDSLCRLLPCVRSDDPVPFDENRPMCCPLARVALSVASIAVAIFTTTLFLATSDILALGLSVAFGIAAIILWPKRGGGGMPPPYIQHVHNTFESTLPFMPQMYPTHYPSPTSMPFPLPGMVSYSPPDSRVPVGRGGCTATPGVVFGGGFTPHAADPIGEQRIPVGGRGGAYRPPVVHQQFAPPAPPRHGGYDEQRVPVASHAPTMMPPRVPVLPPAMGTPTQQYGEQRVPVGPKLH